MAFSYGDVLLHRVWLPPHRLFLLQRKIEFITAGRRNTKGSLHAAATGSFRHFGLLLPRPLQTGSGGDLVCSGNVVAAHSSPGFRGCLPQSRLIQALRYCAAQAIPQQVWAQGPPTSQFFLRQSLCFPPFPPPPDSSGFTPAQLGWLQWELSQKLSCCEGPCLSEASPAQGSGQGPILQQRSRQDLCVEDATSAVGSLQSG